MIKTERVQFPGAHGDPIAARLEIPERPAGLSRSSLIAFTCTKDYKAVVRISRRLAERRSGGLQVRFHRPRRECRGVCENELHLQSRGSPGRSPVSAGSIPGAAAADRTQPREGRPFSRSPAVSRRLGQWSRLRHPAIPSISAGNCSGWRPSWPDRDEATVTIAGRSFQVRRQLLADLESHRMSEYLSALDRPSVDPALATGRESSMSRTR